MKKYLSLLLALVMVLSMMSFAHAEGAFTPGTYEAKAEGFGGDVKAVVTVDENVITAIEITGDGETPGLGGAAMPMMQEAYVGEADAEAVDGMTGATITSTAVKEAVGKALEKAKAGAAAPAEAAEAAVAFTAGEYTATAAGYNGPVEVKVTFSADKLEAIEIVSAKETEHVGDVAFDIMIPDMIEANGSGVDGVSGATFSSRALRSAVNDAAEQAGCANLDAFKAAKVEYTPGETIEDTWDVVIVGAGGAGLAAAAQAAQDGSTVLILEKAAEMGGNTLVSGGAFQSVMPYLVWDKNDPDATSGINPIDGQEYAKVLNDAGRIDTLKTILTWSEEPFDGTLDADHPFVAGDISLNAVRGVHEEYLPTLKALKEEINEYLAWAQPKLDAGEPETKITLFSTLNLHIFQTYYGGLRPNADGTEWIYGRYDLVSQVIEGGQDIKSWLVDQGALFDYARQSTLIGCLWQRENSPQGGVVDGVTYPSKWGSYFMVPYNTVKNANEHNELMTRTTATELITEDGKVVGVKAEKFDGTEVIAHAAKGVILATGGYGANIPVVQESNEYWKPEYIADNIGTTNRSGLTGDGLTMAQAVGADIEGMGWTQMMPLGWVDNGNLAGGAGENVIFINAQTGERYVDESAERDVLSLGAFENSMSLDTAAKLGLKQVPGIYVEVSNVNTQAGPGGFNNEPTDVEGRMIFRTVEETAELIGCDAATLRKTIEDYDAYVMGVADKLDVEKLSLRGTVGQVETDENGKYLPETYKLDKIRVRFMAPSTHHTMGGIKVDTDRRVLNTEGTAIAGLYAAGEVTGGIHAGNRLGGNAVTEIIVSGRTAVKAIEADTAEAPAEEAAPVEETPAEEIPVEETPAAEGAFIPGTYEAKAEGFGGDVKAVVTVDEAAITAIEISGDGETPGLGGAAMPLMQEAYVGQADAEAVDGMAGATITSTAVKEAVAKALEAAKGAAPAADENAAMTFTPGVYEATAAGYNGPTTVKVTFAEDKIEAIEIVSTVETGHVGDVAFDIMIPDMLEANGSGVDGVSGATFSSRALRTAVNDAAEQAGCTNLDAFKAAKVEHPAQDAITMDYDVVVVGAGGAGIAAAAQAAQDGNTVLVIEKNAEVGGNTLVSGGQYQSVMPYLVWDPADPDATTGTYAFNGETYDKVKSVQGCINELNLILNWSEEPFDEDYYKDHEFVAGDAQELSKHGVHAEYLPILQALKAEIREYFVWAAPQLAAGKDESQLTLFSTINLHIFQTYYGGLRPSADGSEWIYGDVDLVKQFITGGQGLKEWLEAQGATFIENTQPTLIGALWYRENEFIGSTIDLDGDGNPEMGRWGSYFAAPISTIYAANDQNKIMTRTTANELIVDGGRVVGVKATMYDGTEVTANAKKGVILATGGYAANIGKVLDANVYWSTEYLSTATKTTNRSSLQGDGITMAEAVGAGTTGLGFTQLMPISWVDNGNLAFGGGNYACWINPTTGHRFVDEGSERDVLSLAEFRNGMEVNGTKGVFLEFYNKEQLMPAPMQLAEGDYEGRYYRRTIAELPELFAELGVTADPEVVVQTIRAYDAAVMGQGEYPDVGKAIASRTIGNVQKDENGKYLPDTYDLDNALLTIRLMAPSTHHTMGGISVDTDRHVLTADGDIIPGLYAAGEVTGGIHGGNRLGGNAIVEIFVSGRTAAQAVTADNE